MPQPLLFIGGLVSELCPLMHGWMLSGSVSGSVIRYYADLYSVAYVALFIICARNVKVVSNSRFMIILF